MALVSVTIAASGSLSTDADLAGAGVVAIITPAAWDSAAITFQVLAQDNSTYIDLFDALLGEVTVPAASISTSASRRIALPPLAFEGVTRVKVRSGVSGTAVTQTAARTLYLVTRAFA